MKLVKKSLITYINLFWLRNIFINFKYLIFICFKEKGKISKEILEKLSLSHIGLKYISNIKYGFNKKLLGKNYILLYFNKYSNNYNLLNNKYFYLNYVLYKNNLLNNKFYNKLFLYNTLYSNNYNIIIYYLELFNKLFLKVIWQLRYNLLLLLGDIKKKKEIGIKLC